MQNNIALENIKLWREAASENRELRSLQIHRLVAPYASATAEDEELRALVVTLFPDGAGEVSEQIALCRALSSKSSSESFAATPAEVRVAMLSGEPFTRAFSTFSPLFQKARMLYFSSLGEVLEETAGGSADFAILPIEDTRGGRFLHFYEELDRLELHITHTCDVISPESERSVRFALISRLWRPHAPLAADPILECSLSGEDGDELGALLAAASAAGLTLLRVDTLPNPYREGSFLYYASFRTNGAGAVLERYFSLFMPRAGVTARYDHLKEVEHK